MKTFKILKHGNEYPENSKAWHLAIDFSYAGVGSLITAQELAKIHAVEVEFYDDVTKLVEDGLVEIVAPKVWTIEDEAQYHGAILPRLPVGTKFRTTSEYSGGDDKTGPLTGTIVGYEVRDEEPNKIIGLEYSHREIYKVWLDSGEFSVMWPMEIEEIK